MNKTVIIEYIENMYGLTNNYLKNNKNQTLEELLKKLEDLEASFEKCNNPPKKITDDIKDVINEMEVIINE